MSGKHLVESETRRMRLMRRLMRRLECLLGSGRCGRLRYAAKYWDYMEKFLDRCRKYLTIVNGIYIYMYRMSMYRNGDQRKHQI